MNGTTQVTSTGLFELISQQGMMGKIILLGLLMISVFCWAIILTKWKTLNHTQKQNEKFLDYFWQGKSLDEIFNRIDDFSASSVASVFKSGFKELKKLASQPESLQTLSAEVENISRALSRSAQSEVYTLEKYISWLATVASAAPFIGLFGTVWGIMNSFQNIGSMGSASLAVVAPGISEALIATATGLFAAIPAAISYNWFINKIKRVAVDMDCFSQDFLNIVQRSFIANRRTKTPTTTPPTSMSTPL